jgi:hypothetical protein
VFGDIHSKLSVESGDLTLREGGAGKSLQQGSSRIEESSVLLIVRKDSDEPL